MIKRGYVVAIILISALLSGLIASTNIFSKAADAAGTPQIPIPKDWGPLKAALPGLLMFEDSNGTVRLVTMEDKFSVFREYIRK